MERARLPPTDVQGCGVLCQVCVHRGVHVRVALPGASCHGAGGLQQPLLHLRADVTGRRRGPLAVRARVPRGTGLGVAQAAPRGSGRRCGPTARAPCRHGAWRCRCGGRRSTAVHGGQHWHKDAGVGPCCSGRGRGAGSTAAAEDGTRGSVGTPGSGSRRSSGSGSGSTAALVCSSRSGVGG